MKILKKLLLIHWHYFSHEVIEFDKINFLTGKNASGKSTVIDALQLLFLADTSGSYFNKAANGKSNRTLSGYLRGELGDDGDVGVRCLRNGRFTSYIAAEFYDDIKQSYFTAGCCFDFYSDGDIPRMFFRFDGPIPKSEFMVNRVPLDIKGLRQYIKTNYPSTKNYTTETNRDFKDDFYGRLGGLQNRFGDLLRKAVPFDPIIDIQKFITSFVCEEQQNVDISLMQENIRSYKNLEDEAAVLEERKERLLKIIKTYESFKSLEGQEYLYHYLIKRAQIEGKIQELNRTEYLIQENKAELKRLGLEIAEQSAEKDKINEERNEKIADKKNNSITQTVDSLERRQRECQTRIQQIDTRYQQSQGILHESISDWKERLRRMFEPPQSVDTGILAPALQERIHGHADSAKVFLADVETLKALQHDTLIQLGAEKLQTCASRAQALARNTEGIWERLGDEQVNFAQRKAGLEKEQKQLKKGIYSFPQTAVDLREAIYGELSCRFGIDVQVNIVAELVEIKNDRWRNAIEGYLNNQKYNIIVAPEYFKIALRVYDHIKEQKKIYGVGLVDIAAIMEKKPVGSAGSLVEEIETKNAFAKVYMDYLLGRVMKCDRVEQLQDHLISITDEGMLYQGYVARRINPQNWEKPAIGSSAIRRRLAVIEAEIEQYQHVVINCTLLKKAVEPLKELAVLSPSDISTIVDAAMEYDKIPLMQQEIEQIKAELKTIDQSPLLALEEAIDRLKKEFDLIEKKLEEKTRRSGALENQIKINEEQTIQTLQNEIYERQNELGNSFEAKWIENIGIPRYEKESFSKSTAEIERNFYAPFKKAESNKNDEWQSLRDMRKEYNSFYKMGYNEDSAVNDDYDDAWLELSEIQLPSYVAKIEDARRKAFEQFQEDFLSRLQFNIRTAETQIKQLNDALRGYSFGEDRYQFKIIPKAEYKRFYTMITDNTLLESGYNLFSGQFNEKYKEEIAELFSLITESGSGSRAQEREEYERRVREFTNYRTYLSFDLEVMSPDGEVQRLSKTLGKKSGGETQTPFYIAVLASFAQLYRIGRDKSANTSRIIIFDEAFSKMDGERISQSIELLRKFDFQVILSAPPDKVGDIATLVDRILCVLRQDKKTFVKSFLPRQLEELYHAD